MKKTQAVKKVKWGGREGTEGGKKEEGKKAEDRM